MLSLVPGVHRYEATSMLCSLSLPRKKSQCRSYAQNEAQKDHLQRISWLLVTFLNAKVHLIVLRR